jgi:hypothetical protein
MKKGRTLARPRKKHSTGNAHGPWQIGPLDELVATRTD